MSARRPPGPPPLIFGPYVQPDCMVGDAIVDVLRGPAIVGGFRSAPMSWPTHPNRSPHSRHASLIITAELARAIRLESSVALQYWLGVSEPTITKLRQALGVGRNTLGTLLRHAEVAIPPDPASSRLGAILGKRPEAMAKWHAAMQGRPRRPLSAATREAIAAGMKRYHARRAAN